MGEAASLNSIAVIGPYADQFVTGSAEVAQLRPSLLASNYRPTRAGPYTVFLPGTQAARKTAVAARTLRPEAESGRRGRREARTDP